MLVDTHCHINIMVKNEFDTPLAHIQLEQAGKTVNEAVKMGVTRIVNVGTSLIESNNCIALAKRYKEIFAVVGIHPNDLKQDWKKDLTQLKQLLKKKEESKIVGIGECGLDFHYPEYDVQQQKDAFKMQIELALEHDLGLVVHTRNASQETLAVIEPYKSQIKKGIIHCFSENADFANIVIDWGFVIGIGGIITYPKNNYLRDIVKNSSLDSIVLETDAPYLPIQSMRGKQNSPQFINAIAHYIAKLKNVSFETVAQQTTAQAIRIFNF